MPPPPPPLPSLLRATTHSCRRPPRLSPSAPQQHIRSRCLTTTPRASHYLTGTNTSATLPPTWFESSTPSQQGSEAPMESTEKPGSATRKDSGSSSMRTNLRVEKDEGIVKGQGASSDGGRGGTNNQPNKANSNKNAGRMEEHDENRPRRRGDPDHEPPDERTLQLGRTIRTLQSRMPTLLHSPLPSEILSPHVSLQLFPSTHPDLPIVRGRVAYIAALWTSPVAWGRLPGSSTSLEVLSERMLPDERLKIRWRAGSGFESGSTEVQTRNGDDKKSFQGIFIFEFDESGKVGRHIIENVEEDDSHVGGVITVTEWLMRAAKGKAPLEGAGGGKGLAWECRREDGEGRR